MKKLILLVLVFILLLTAPFSYAQKLGALDEIDRPESLKVSGNELFVVQGAQVFNYSLDNLKLIRTFGRGGEGPGELKKTSQFYNTVAVTPEHVFIDGMGKVVYFSRDGKLIKEIKKPSNINRMHPVGKNYVGVQFTELEGDVQYFALRLFDAQFKPVKTLLRHKSPMQSSARTNEPVPDIIGFRVWKDKIYVENSRRGFVIEVFDHRGNKLSAITLDQEKQKMTPKDRREAYEFYFQDPLVKQIGVEAFKSMMKFIPQDYFPPIQRLEVTDQTIYAGTFKRKKGKYQWLLMDLTGKQRGEIFLPKVNTAPLLAHIAGVTYDSINNGKLYYLQENEETETWELFAVEIK